MEEVSQSRWECINCGVDYPFEIVAEVIEQEKKMFGGQPELVVIMTCPLCQYCEDL